MLSLLEPQSHPLVPRSECVGAHSYPDSHWYSFSFPLEPPSLRLLAVCLLALPPLHLPRLLCLLRLLVLPHRLAVPSPPLPVPRLSASLWSKLQLKERSLSIPTLGLILVEIVELPLFVQYFRMFGIVARFD